MQLVVLGLASLLVGVHGIDPCLRTWPNSKQHQGTVKVMYFQWWSSEVINYIFGIIMRDVMGYDVEMVSSTPLQVCMLRRTRAHSSIFGDALG